MLSLSTEVKYLGTNLYSKLHLKRNIEVRMGNALIAFSSSNRIFRTKWDMRPGMAYRLYEAIILILSRIGV